METAVACVAGRIVGFITIHIHYPPSAEIQVMGVRPDAHRQGVGRALVQHAEAALSQGGVRFLQVKTLGPSRPDAHYAQTRQFYEAMGFVPLEETDLWGEVNPCLILIKSLENPGAYRW